MKGEIISVGDEVLAGDIVDALSFIVHNDFAYYRGRAIVVGDQKQLPPTVMFAKGLGTSLFDREPIRAILSQNLKIPSRNWSRAWFV